MKKTFLLLSICLFTQMKGQIRLNQLQTGTPGSVIMANGSGIATWSTVPTSTVTNWNILGNAVSTNTNFIGTTNNHSFDVKTNNVVRSTMDASGTLTHHGNLVLDAGDDSFIYKNGSGTFGDVLYQSDINGTVNFSNGQLIDAIGNTSIDYKNRFLVSPNGATMLDWSDTNDNLHFSSGSFIGTGNGKLAIGTVTIDPVYDIDIRSSNPGGIVGLSAQNTHSTGFSFVQAISDDNNTYASLNVFNTAGGVGTLYDNNVPTLTFGGVNAAIINENPSGRIIFGTTTYGPLGEAMRIDNSKNVSISGSASGKIATPTALLHLAASGTTQPLRFTSQSLVTGSSIIAGGIEYTGSAFYATVSTGTTAINRMQLATVLTTTATLDFTSTSAQTSSELTITITGAAVGDVVSIGLPAAPNANCDFMGYVSATNTVKIRFNNYSSSAIDPASATYKATIIKNQ